MVNFLHKKMTWEEFEDFPRRIGWKHEYYDGSIHLSPSKTAIASLRLTTSPLSMPISPGLRPVLREDEPALVALFEHCFRNAVEYAGWPARAFHEESRENVHDFFEETDRAYPGASLLLEDEGQLIAAGLIRQIRRGPILQPIFVASNRQRQGIGSGMLRTVVHRLHELGETALFSRCHLGNPSSMAWHLKNGFQELPSLFVAQHRAYFYSAEAERFARSGDPAQSDEASRLANAWWKEAQRLQSMVGESRDEVFGILD